MSKQQIAKYAQGYREQGPTCERCAHFRSDVVKIHGKWGAYTKEKNIRCDIGKFTVKKRAWCKRFTQSSPTGTPEPSMHDATSGRDN